MTQNTQADSEDIFAECKGWALEYRRSDGFICISQGYYSEQWVQNSVVLTMEQIPELVKALERLHREESENRSH